MKVDSGLSSSIDELERYMLECILAWKVHYIPPADFIRIIMNKFAEANVISNTITEAIISKAQNVSELLFLCNKSQLLIQF